MLLKGGRGVFLFSKYAVCVNFGWPPTDWNKDKCLYENRKFKLMLLIV